MSSICSFSPSSSLLQAPNAVSWGWQWQAPLPSRYLLALASGRRQQEIRVEERKVRYSFYTSGFIIILPFNLLPLQISGSKQQNKSLFCMSGHSLGMATFIQYRSGCCQISLSQNILSPGSGNCTSRAKAKSRGKQAYAPKKGRIKMDGGNKEKELSDKLSSTCLIAGLCVACSWTSVKKRQEVWYLAVTIHSFFPFHLASPSSSLPAKDE